MRLSLPPINPVDADFDFAGRNGENIEELRTRHKELATGHSHDNRQYLDFRSRNSSAWQAR